MKSLKMFAIALLSMLVMTMGVHAACSADAEITLDGECKATLADELGDLDDSKAHEIILQKAVTIDETVTIPDGVEVTINLNGKNLAVKDEEGLVVPNGTKLTLTGSGSVLNTTAVTIAGHSLITVKAGATLVVDGSVKLINKGTSTDSAAIMVEGNDDEALSTSVTVGKSVTVTSDNHGLVLGVKPTTKAKNTTLNLDGKWTTEAYVVKVNGFIDYDENAPVVKVTGGEFTSKQATALYASGYAAWTINAKSVKGAQAIAVRSGKVNVESGYYEASNVTNSKGAHDSDTGFENNAISILGPETVAGNSNYNAAEYIDVTISGGEFTAKKQGAYAIYLGEIDDESKIAINAGTFKSAKDGNNKQLPAMSIKTGKETVVMDDHKGMVSGGEFIGGLIGKITAGLNEYTADEAAKILASVEFTTDDNGNMTVGNGAQAPDKKPEDQGNTGDGTQTTTPGDTNPDVPDVPKTNDNILVYAGLGLVSALTVSFSAKRKENN